MPTRDADYLRSQEALDTWREFSRAFFSHIRRFDHLIHPSYRNNLHVLHDFSDRLPTLEEIKHILRPFGWTAQYVDGYAPPWRIARMIARQIMPVSRQIRPKNEIMFAREPDFIHDLFGHLPTLCDAEYRRLLLRWASGAIKEPVTEIDRAQYHLNKLIVQTQDQVPSDAFDRLQSATQALAAFSQSRPSRLFRQDKIYFWMFEFGMIESLGERKIFGAGILSSLSELEKIATQPITTARLTPMSCQTHYNISSEQNLYLVMPNTAAYDEFLDEMTVTQGKSPQIRYAEVAYV
jgi:phenylalanine-4-hydroxylase